jgi:hypothetical protein
VLFVMLNALAKGLYYMSGPLTVTCSSYIHFGRREVRIEYHTKFMPLATGKENCPAPELLPACIFQVPTS